MKKIASVAEAKVLLHEIQEKVRQDGLLFMKNREQNRQTMGNLGITVEQVKEIIYGLQPTDYCGGPEPDEKYPWKSVSVFGTVFCKLELYIKFSIGVKGTPVVCLSFHEAKRPMVYQFK